MSAEYVSGSFPLMPGSPATAAGKRMLQFVVAAAMLLAASELAVLRADPTIEAPPDAEALLAFGQALIGQ